MGDYRYLLDTNIVFHMIRDPQGPVLNHLESIDPHTVCTSIVVAAEISFGLKKKTSNRLINQARQILSVLDILPLQAPVDEHYGDIRAYLAQKGMLIGGNDLFIAAHARSLDLVLVTDNTREFSRVPGLMLENWI